MTVSTDRIRALNDELRRHPARLGHDDGPPPPAEPHDGDALQRARDTADEIGAIQVGVNDIDRVLIQQILVNLIRNGLESMATTPDDHRKIIIDAVAIAPAFVEIAVTDTGAGVPPDVARDLFQPFISTKPGGMGMGLSICRSIVELHGGRIAYAPAGTSSRFAFTLAVAGA